MTIEYGSSSPYIKYENTLLLKYKKYTKYKFFILYLVLLILINRIVFTPNVTKKCIRCNIIYESKYWLKNKFRWVCIDCISREDIDHKNEILRICSKNMNLHSCNVSHFFI